MRKKKDHGFQYLRNDFWDLIATRKIYRTPQHLYIYLRGKYCRFGPEFDWSDIETMRLLGISRSTLVRSRKYLQERGLILCKSGLGENWTHYTMLTSVLLPELNRGGVVKMTRRCRQNDETVSSKSAHPIIYRVNNKDKNKECVSHKKEEGFKRYDPNAKTSLKYKKRLKEILGGKN